jgi:eukaryotic-like serine/threonine-protein kinase
MTRANDETGFDRSSDDATRLARGGSDPRRVDTDDATRVLSGPAPSAGSALLPGDEFGRRYRIIKQLGAGGMGVVYQAWDEVLNVVVALKVMRPDASLDRAEARALEKQFKRELLLARQVTHKHVVRIHDLGDVDGTKYITMSFVEGEDLVHTLKREGKLPVAQVVRLAKQIASGLEAAHDAGVVHRDLKPANIMVDAEGDALIMDFGIALPATARSAAPAMATAAAVVASEAATGFAPTVAGDMHQGAIIGTLDYMSPEQSKGQHVDHRSDLYTFGLILTDLLLGPRVRDPGTSPWEALTDRISTPPKPIAIRHPAVPAAFDEIITKCLQLDPSDRFQTTGDLVKALARLDDVGNYIPEPRRFTPRMMAAASVLLAGALGTTWWLARGSGAPAAREPVSVLVGDFANPAGDPVFNGHVIEQALSVGIEGATFVEAYSRRDATRLARAIRQDGTLDEQTARLISMREGIDVIIGGKVIPEGGRYNLEVKATRASDDQVLLDWSTTAANKDAVLDAVGRMAAQVRGVLGDTNTENAASAAETFTAASIDAARMYSEAQELQWAGKADEAIAAYKRTLELDPNFGRAHAGLAALYANQGRAQDAEASYQAALGVLDRMTEREKYRTRGGYYLFKLNGENAMKEFEALVAQFPADTSGLANLAFAHFLRRDMKMAREVGVRASDAYPQNVIRRNNAALYAMYAGDFDEAAKFANEVLQLNPQYAKAYVALGISQLAGGKVQESVATYRQLKTIDSATARSFAVFGLTDVALYEGRQQEALKLLDEAIAADGASPTSATARRLAIKAEVLASRGEKGAAVRAAHAAVADRAQFGTLFTAGRALVLAGQPADALKLADDLDNRLEEEPRVYGALLRGDAALAAGHAREALTSFEAAQKLEDTWMGRFSLGRAYLALEAYPEAASEFDRCLSRRGEASAVFLDDLPSYRLLPAVHYYLARAREGMKSATAVDAYRAFLEIKAKGDERTLIFDAAQRLKALESHRALAPTAKRPAP